MGLEFVVVDDPFGIGGGGGGAVDGGFEDGKWLSFGAMCLYVLLSCSFCLVLFSLSFPFFFCCFLLNFW